MNISTQHIFESHLLESAPEKLYIGFKERRKCLNHVFWTVYNELSKGNKVLLIVRDEDELEYLNYFLSRYQLQQLSLVVDGRGEAQLSYTLSRLEKREDLQLDMRAFEQIGSTLDDKIRKLEENLERHYESCLGNVSLVGAGLNVTDFKVRELKSRLYPEIAVNDFRVKKKMIETAVSIYQPEYRYNNSFELFNKDVFRRYDIQDVLGIIKECVEELEKLGSKFEDIYQTVFNQIQKSYLKDINEIKLKLRKIKTLTQERGKLIDDTLQKKIEFHSRELFDILDDSDKYSGDSIRDMEALDCLIKARVKYNNERVACLMTETVMKLNTNNSEYDLASIFNACRELMTRINEYGLFNENVERFCFSFSQYRSWLSDMLHLCRKADYLMSFEKGLLAWYMMLNDLGDNDRHLVLELMDIGEDWMSTFEKAFLKSFVKAKTAELDNLSRMHDPFMLLWEDYASKAHHNIYKLFDARQGQMHWEGEMPSNWNQLFESHAQQLLNRFPLIMLKSDFIDGKDSKLYSYCDEVVCINCTPDLKKLQECNNFLIASYDEHVDSVIFPQVKRIPLCATRQIDGVHFNVNRSSHFLNASELNNLSSYLAFGLNYFRKDIRIFQTRDYSIVSILAYDRNRKLLELEGLALKEIFTHDEQVKLLPGIFSDTDRKPVVLIEDEILNPYMPEKLVHQKLFIEEMRTGGIQVISIDNYEMLSRGVDTFESIIHKSLGKSSHIEVND